MNKEAINELIKLEQLDTSLSCLRLLRPVQLKMMQESLERLGQLNPVVVRREDNIFQVLDGFKRYHAAERLGWKELQARILDIPITYGKAMILNYNKTSRSLLDYDEALVVYSLKKDHMMDQEAISKLTGYSRSWVCRRLGLIERLSEVVQQQVRMGMISNSQAREMVKLPRGNQEDVMRAIITHNLTSRESSVLVEKYLQSSSRSEQEYIIKHPKAVIEQASHKDDIHDSRLSQHGNRLLKSIELLSIQQNIFIGQFTHHQTGQLRENEINILFEKLGRIAKNAGTIQTVINSKKQYHE